MTVTTPAIVLRAVNYGEADRVITLLGRATGRVSAMARNARKSTRRFGGGLGPAVTGNAVLRERAGADVAGLESFEITKGRQALASDVVKTAHAAYVVELCEKLIGPRADEPGMFDWLDRCLDLIEAGAPTSERLRVFEMGLLGKLGLAPAVTACVVCNRDEDALGDEPVRWVPARGGIVCRTCGSTGRPMAPAVRRALAEAQRRTLDESEGWRLPREVNTAAREAIAEVLAEHLPGPLRSLEFIAKLGKGEGR